MSEQLAIVTGLLGTSALFAYFAFQFYNREEELDKRLAVLFFFMSLMFADFLVYSLARIAEAGAFAYLTEGIANFAFQMMIWITLFMALWMLLMILAIIAKLLWYAVAKGAGIRIPDEDGD